MKFAIKLTASDGPCHETVTIATGVTQAVLAAKDQANWPAERRIIAVEVRRIGEGVRQARTESAELVAL